MGGGWGVGGGGAGAWSGHEGSHGCSASLARAAGGRSHLVDIRQLSPRPRFVCIRRDNSVVTGFLEKELICTGSSTAVDTERLLDDPITSHHVPSLIPVRVTDSTDTVSLVPGPWAMYWNVNALMSRLAMGKNSAADSASCAMVAFRCAAVMETSMVTTSCEGAAGAASGASPEGAFGLEDG